MSVDAAWIALAGAIAVAYTVEAALGFGSIVIALALGALVLPMSSLLPVLVPLSTAMNVLMTLRLRAQIDRALLLRRIAPWMIAGMLAGYLLRPWLGDAALVPLFGALVLAFALREGWRMRHAGTPRPHPPWRARALTAAAGLTHGLYASGGPLLVAALAGTTLDKVRLRATLIAVWLVLNGSLTLLYALDGTLAPSLPTSMAYLPVMVAGIVAGEALHRRIDERLFRQLVLALLAITGAALLLRGA